MPGKVEEAAPNKIWLRREFGKEQVNYELNRESSLFKRFMTKLTPLCCLILKRILSKLRKTCLNLKSKTILRKISSF